MADVCKLTGKEGRFVKCHLYPKSFYNPPSDGDHMVIFGPGERHKRSPVGIYDDELVIGETEAFFAELDQYAFNFLSPDLRHDEFVAKSAKQHRSQQKLIAVEFDDVDFPKLHLFFVSLIWRWAASTRSEAAGVTLGPYFHEATDALLNRTPRPDLFGFQIIRYVDDVPYFVAAPDRFRLKETNCFRMILGRYLITMRCDRRGAVGRHFVLEGRQAVPLKIGFARLDETPLRRTMTKMIRDHEEAYGYPWPHRESND